MAVAETIQIDYVSRLAPIIFKPKRIKILVGGRASTKTTFVADHCIERVSHGKVWCCGREFQNIIDESVHSTLRDEIERLDYQGFDVKRNEITHTSGGYTFYRGLARNITGLKGLNCDTLWIEEGESLSEDTLRVLTASIRVTALEQTRAKREGREIKIPETIITMNRGSSKDAVSKRFLARAEKELEQCGYYEDDLVMIIEINWDENPWFEGSGLEPERLDDLKHLSQAAYDHKWNGAYSDTVEDAIIEPEWFDKCIDAHKVLGFKPEGVEIVAHDPNDGGKDAAGIAHRHGSVIVHVDESENRQANRACAWALDYVQECKPDAFIWDSVGIGAGLKSQIYGALGGKKIDVTMFNGQSKIDRPDEIYEPTPGMIDKERTNREMFYNRRAQRYWNLRDRVYRTYLAVTEGSYTDPGKLISFDSTMPKLKTLRAEMCRIPRKRQGQGKIQIMSKDEMAREGIDSPNMADCVMMTMDIDGIEDEVVEIEFDGW